MAHVELPMSMGDVVAQEGFQIAPTDNYKLSVKKAETKTSEKGRYLNVQYEIVENPEFEGTTIFEIVVMPSAIDDPKKMANKASMFKAWYTKLQHPITSEAFDIPDDGFNEEDLQGLVINAEVGIETYTTNDGVAKEKNKVKKYF